MLEIGEGERTIRLRGRIDRIDVAETPEGSRFRVIDYKSGSVPSSTDVKHGEMLQLPLYAMAVERLLFQDGAAGLFDLGYWSLKKDGFKPIAFASWDEDQKALRGPRAGPGRRASPGRLRGPVAERRIARATAITGASAGSARSAAPRSSRAEPAGAERPDAAGHEGIRGGETGGRRGGTMTAKAQASGRLTDEQRDALEVKDESVALGAGAGCGKTTVLTERFLAEIDGPEGRALRALVALTFTDKAARELRQRIRGRCRERLAAGEDADRWRSVLRALEAAPIGTFHEFAGRLLRAHAVEIGIDPEFVILDEAVASSLRDQADPHGAAADARRARARPHAPGLRLRPAPDPRGAGHAAGHPDRRRPRRLERARAARNSSTAGRGSGKSRGGPPCSGASSPWRAAAAIS